MTELKPEFVTGNEIFHRMAQEAIARDEEILTLRSQLSACQRERDAYKEACGDLSPADLEKLLDRKFEQMFGGDNGIAESLCALAEQGQDMNLAEEWQQRAESAEQQLVEAVAMRDKWINYAFVGAVVPPLPNGREKELPTAIESLQQQLQQMTREREEAQYQRDGLKTMLDGSEERAESAEKQLQQMKEALRLLSNEVTGMMVAFESEIRGAISNTNYTCVMSRLTAARDLVSGKE